MGCFIKDVFIHNFWQGEMPLRFVNFLKVEIYSGLYKKDLSTILARAGRDL